MNAKQKLSQLTNSWYGYSLFAAVLSVMSIRASGVLSFAIGFGLSVAINAVAFVLSIAIVTFLGRRLLAGSRATRLFLVVVSGLCTLFGVLGTLGAAWAFLHLWSVAALLQIVLSGAWTMLCARSFSVLGDTDVRAHFV